MKKYNFLFKPVFFIFSLILAARLVLYIEKIQPSDLGKYESLFREGPGPALKKLPGPGYLKQKQTAKEFQRQCLRNLCIEYKRGTLDSTALEEKIKTFLQSANELSKKNP